MKLHHTIILGYGFFFGASAQACTSSAQRTAAAESTYTADMLRCVDDASTLAESKACRERVRAAWHVDGGAK